MPLRCFDPCVFLFQLSEALVDIGEVLVAQKKLREAQTILSRALDLMERLHGTHR